MSDEGSSGSSPGGSRGVEKTTNDAEKRGCVASLISVAGAAFLLSFALAAQSWLQVLSRASVTVLGPTHVYVYRSGSSDAYPLAVAVQIPMANASEGYSDFLTEASLEIEGINRRHPVTMTVNPTLFLTEEAAAESCDRSALNCLPLGRLAIVERDWDHITRVPAGDAHNLYYSFEITCIPDDCPGVTNYRAASQYLSRQGNLKFRVSLRFHGDGRRAVSCNIDRFEYDRLIDRHWQSATCSTSDSTDLRPWYQRWTGLG
jgi:hypothetical protein